LGLVGVAGLFGGVQQVPDGAANEKHAKQEHGEEGDGDD
jgi:hypothetical protein